MKSLSVVAVAFVVSSEAVSAPLLNDVTAANGEFIDGAPLTLTGSGFGDNALDFQWLGGPTGLIETSPDGVPPPNGNGWIFDQGLRCNQSPTSTQAHSGTQSLHCSLDENNFEGVLRYQHAHDIGPNQDIFVSWWVRRTHQGDGQWKMFRLSYENDITDGAPEAVMFNWYNANQFFVRIDFGAKDTKNYPPYPKEDDRWYRMDFLVHTSSVGASDGRYTVTLHDPQSGTAPKSSAVDGMSYETDAAYYRWFLWQNYMGNGITSQEVWMDDLYVQTGTQARVELGDKPAWEDCTFREIQPASQWADGSISLALNTGSFHSGDTAYLYVVDGQGAASAGLPVTIGGMAPMSPDAGGGGSGGEPDGTSVTPSNGGCAIGRLHDDEGWISAAILFALVAFFRRRA